MLKKTLLFSSKKVTCYFDTAFDTKSILFSETNSIFITDENIFAKHKSKFKNRKTIIIPSGEQNKIQATVDSIIDQLIDFGADRQTLLVGVGGGVVTDITGYVAGIYMRGVNFGFVPTSILAMVDASIGGKNGIDLGLYKNIIGLIRQPSFILYDYSFLKSLPKEEWVNGFAEIIKHACIKDPILFSTLETRNIGFYQKNKVELSNLIKRNVMLKSNVVSKDEFEEGQRKILNFGHTIGHAIENLYSIPHGQAVAIGMVAACKISSTINGFKESDRVEKLLKQYGLTPQMSFDKTKTFDILQKDKKKVQNNIHFIALKKIGKAEILNLTLDKFHLLFANL